MTTDQPNASTVHSARRNSIVVLSLLLVATLVISAAGVAAVTEPGPSTGSSTDAAIPPAANGPGNADPAWSNGVMAPGEPAVEPSATTMTADRRIENATLEPGQSTVVSVHVETEDKASPAVYETIDAGEATVELVNASPSATVTGVSDDNTNVFAAWNGTDDAAIRYRITAPENASSGETVSINGDAEVASHRVGIDGESTITVRSGTNITTAERTVDRKTVAPGESVTVSTTVALSKTGDIALYEAFGEEVKPVDIVDDSPPSAISTVRNSSELVAIWEETDSATIEYEITISSEATIGETVALDGVLDVWNDSHEVTGVTELQVDAPSHVAPPPASPESPNISITSTTVSDTTIDVTEPVSVTAAVRNDGDAAGHESLSLTVDGVVVANETVSLGPGERSTVTFTREFTDPGPYTVAVDGVSAGTVRVRERSGEIRVTDASVSSTDVDVGDEITVTASVTNTGPATASRSVGMLLDGSEVASEEISLGAGEQTSVSFTRTFEAEGTFDIAVGAVHAGTVTVSSTEGSSESPAGNGGDSTPGFGIVLALCGGGIVLARRARGG